MVFSSTEPMVTSSPNSLTPVSTNGQIDMVEALRRDSLSSRRFMMVLGSFRLVRSWTGYFRKEIPKETGFLVGLKFNSYDFQNNEASLDDAKIMSQIIDVSYQLFQNMAFVCVPISTFGFQDKGFDFIELSGGNYERLAFQHVRESTKKREAFFLEFSDQVVNTIFHNKHISAPSRFQEHSSIRDWRLQNSCSHGQRYQGRFDRRYRTG